MLISSTSTVLSDSSHPHLPSSYFLEALSSSVLTLCSLTFNLDIMLDQPMACLAFYMCGVIGTLCRVSQSCFPSPAIGSSFSCPLILFFKSLSLMAQVKPRNYSFLQVPSLNTGTIFPPLFVVPSQEIVRIKEGIRRSRPLPSCTAPLFLLSVDSNAFLSYYSFSSFCC